MWPCIWPNYGTHVAHHSIDCQIDPKIAFLANLAVPLAIATCLMTKRANANVCNFVNVQFFEFDYDKDQESKKWLMETQKKITCKLTHSCNADEISTSRLLLKYNSVNLAAQTKCTGNWVKLFCDRLNKFKLGYCCASKNSK